MSKSKIAGSQRRGNPNAPPLQHHEIQLVQGNDRVQVLVSKDAHQRLVDAGATQSHAYYRLKRACDQGVVRYMQLDPVRRLYAAEDIELLADAIRDAQG